MGCGRVGWYTYPWIEGGQPDPGRIHPQYRHITEGDLIPELPDGTSTWTVAAADKPRQLVYRTARRMWSQLVPLPVREPDPARRLAQIARLTSARTWKRPLVSRARG